jgi:hypothetical protein
MHSRDVEPSAAYERKVAATRPAQQIGSVMPEVQQCLEGLLRRKRHLVHHSKRTAVDRDKILKRIQCACRDQRRDAPSLGCMPPAKRTELIGGQISAEHALASCTEQRFRRAYQMGVGLQEQYKKQKAGAPPGTMVAKVRWRCQGLDDQRPCIAPLKTGDCAVAHIECKMCKKVSFGHHWHSDS